MTYDFQDFINEIMNLNYNDILNACNSKCIRLERLSGKEKKLGSGKLADNIKGIMYWLDSGAKPAGLSENEFIKLKPLCLKLIEKNQLKSESLEVFKF